MLSYQLQPVEFFTVPGADGTPLDASLIKPPGFDPARKYPVIVYVYGGPQEQVVRDAWQGPDFLWHELMAQKGFVIFSVDNRGMSGRGHNFETPIYHHFGQAELADQLAGVAWLAKQPYVDRSAHRHLGLELRRLHDLHGHAAREAASSRPDLRARRSPTGASTTPSTPSATWARRRKIPKATAIRRR